jgi:hypothetical protein
LSAVLDTLPISSWRCFNNCNCLQQQEILVLQRQCIIELVHHIFLVGELGLHVEQLLDNFFDIGQVRLSPGLSLFPLTKR